MATQEELLQTLTVLEKKSYTDIINVAIKEYSEKKVLFTMLSTAIIKSLNRSTAILQSYDTKYKSSDVTSAYTVFRLILEKISGEVSDLDKTNGTLNMFVYGDAKSQREVRRYVLELRKRNALLLSTILTDLDKAKKNLTTLSEDIAAAT